MHLSFLEYDLRWEKKRMTRGLVTVMLQKSFILITVFFPVISLFVSWQKDANNFRKDPRMVWSSLPRLNMEWRLFIDAEMALLLLARMWQLVTLENGQNPFLSVKRVSIQVMWLLFLSPHILMSWCLMKRMCLLHMMKYIWMRTASSIYSPETYSKTFIIHLCQWNRMPVTGLSLQYSSYLPTWGLDLSRLTFISFCFIGCIAYLGNTSPTRILSVSFCIKK